MVRTGRKRGPRARRPWAGWAAGLGAVALALAIAIALRRPSPAPAPATMASIPSRAMADSARAAVATQRWSRARFWGEAMAAREPQNSSVILGLAAAMNNLVWSVAEADRGAARTSRDRVGLLMDAIALMDSAAALARNEGEWDRALEMKAEALENVGFPTDALALYEGVMRRSPAFAPPRARAAWVIQRMRGAAR